MKDFTFPDEKIIHLKRFQNIVKKKIKIKRELNLELNTLYNIIYGMMTRIYHSFLLSILNQYDYNSYMNQLDEQLINFKKLKRPIKISDVSEKKKKEITTTLKNLKNNLIELSSKSGIKNIFDGIKLVINEIDKKFLDNMDYESKNLLYFYQKVFVPTSMYFYDINRCNYFASQIVKRYGNYNYMSKVPNEHKATAYCKPVYVDAQKTIIY